MQKALIVWGGWLGHQPEEVAHLFAGMLEQENFEVEISDTLDSFLDAEKLKSLDLIVPVWTMGELSREQTTPVVEAVASGVGLAGCHGGMCDSFRQNVQWQFMTGGNWVSHPGGDGVAYVVNIKHGSSPLVDGLADFTVSSEQYYLHIDPAVEILATTRFPVVDWYHSSNGQVDVPVVWTKRWGHGRVYYNALGHQANILELETPKEMMRRGFLWAAEGKRLAVENNLDVSVFASKSKMF